MAGVPSTANFITNVGYNNIFSRLKEIGELTKKIIETKKDNLY